MKKCESRITSTLVEVRDERVVKSATEITVVGC